jgi:hypothetical protein
VFRASINLHDSDGKEIGKAWVHVIENFVNLRAVDWSTQAGKFPPLSSINFPKPFLGGKCHKLLGNNNHHLSTQMQPNFIAEENPQAYPYAYLTPLGWCAAGQTVPPVNNDPVLNIL